MKLKRFRFLIIALLCVIGAVTVSAQNVTTLVSLSVDAGFDGRFRENMWMPLRIEITNNGDPIEGRVLVRPERSNALTNIYSTPVSLPTGSRQTVFLYVTMYAFGTSVRVELFDQNDTLVTDLEVPISSLGARDRLYALVTNATNPNIDLTHVASAEYLASQVTWLPQDVPAMSGALAPINAIVFSEVDTGTLTPSQRQAIREWVMRGGHLIVTGGVNWQPTASGLVDLLPFEPTETVSVTNMGSLLTYAGDYVADFEGDYRAAGGQVKDGVSVLAEDRDGLPLLVRGSLGLGTVDYLTVEPSFDPLRRWRGLSAFWFNLITNVSTPPVWSGGFVNNNPTITALSVLPGVSALPEVMAMILFLLAYVAVIGPINYLILNRLNRKELAWITIPACIVGFTAAAWLTGFNLRGNEATLSRLNLVQVFDDAELAYVDQLIGILVPRRGEYTLTVDDRRVMRPVASTRTDNFLSSVANVEIQQTGQFSARDVPVDASFVAGFVASGTVSTPAISGQVVIRLEDNATALTRLRGSVRNDSAITLMDPIILTDGGVYRLDEPLEAGDVATFDFSVIASMQGFPVPPSPIELAEGTVSGASGNNSSYYFRRSSTRFDPSRTIGEILNINLLDFNAESLALSDFDRQLLARKQYFLETFVIDQYSASSRGGKVFLMGWTDQPIADEAQDAFEGTGAITYDTTLYVVELEVEREFPGTRAVVYPEQFTWVSLDRENFLSSSPHQLTLFSDGLLTYRFTPNPAYQLDEIDELYLVFEIVDGSLRETELSLWDWRARRWRAVEVVDDEIGRYRIEDFEAFIGPQNAVQVRLLRQSAVGQLYIDRIGIEQRGKFD